MSCEGGEQEVYKTEEHTNISLTCSCPTDKPPKSLQIVLESLNPLRKIYLYDSRKEAGPYTDESFRDRVDCDLQLAWRGQIRGFLKHLRINDTGTYHWIVYADEKRFLKMFYLQVTGEQKKLSFLHSILKINYKIYFFLQKCSLNTWC